MGPVLLGAAVATFFNGSDFLVSKSNLTEAAIPVISHWGNEWHGLDALANPWNLMLGLAVCFLARILGCLYFIRSIRDTELIPRCRRQLLGDSVPFLLFFLAFVIHTLLKDGFAVHPETGIIFMEPYKYFHNLTDMPILLCLVPFRCDRCAFRTYSWYLLPHQSQRFLVYRYRNHTDRIILAPVCRL